MKVYKFEFRKPDKRLWIQYSRQPFPSDFAITAPGLLRPEGWQPPRLRFNRMRGEWIAISSSRQERPFLPPKEYCPLCPQGLQEAHTGGSNSGLATEIPPSARTYEWAVFENMFPGLAHEPEGIGHCEVILYSPRHESTLGEESLEAIEGLMAVWQDRSRSVGQMPGIEYVFIFENKGPEVGVTLHHPHGQLYAFNHVPTFVRLEHAEARDFHGRTGKCLICDLAAQELRESARVVLETSTMVAFVPFAARYPYEVHITSKAHRPLFEQLTELECRELADVLKQMIYKYDNLFGFRMPYIMVHHQAASRNAEDPTYHWHIEFYPPYRTASKLKYLAGVESGTGFFINDTVPEEKAAELARIGPAERRREK